MMAAKFSFALLTDVHGAAQDLSRHLFFSAEVESALASSLAELEANVTEEMQKLPEEDWNEYYEGRLEELHNHDIFPFMHRESMVITLHSYLEHHLNTFCSRIGEELGSRIKLKHLHGRGIERALSYLRLVAQFDLSAVEDQITFLIQSNRLRNRVVHNDAVLPNDVNDSVNHFVKAEPSLAGDPNGLVSIHADYLTKLCEHVRRLFEGILHSMQGPATAD